MDICGNHENDEIAYVGKSCPACLEVEGLKEQIAEYETQIEKLNSEIDQLLAEKA